MLGSHIKGRSSARLLRKPLGRVGAALAAGGLCSAPALWAYKRLNTSDDPARGREVRPPVPCSVLDLLSRAETLSALGLQKLSRSRANWVRLALLLHGLRSTTLDFSLAPSWTSPMPPGMDFTRSVCTGETRPLASSSTARLAFPERVLGFSSARSS